VISIDRVLKWFEKICAIPHPSGHEAALRSFIQEWAQANHLKVKTDQAGNLVVLKAGQHRGVNAPTLALQAHLDMVAEKNLGVPHDFLQDPIRLVYEGEWLHADKTTLGADNGAGVALILAILEDQDISHPPLEALFTVDEETGLTGAMHLDPSLLTAKRLINLDSEDTGVITIGCAGGVTGILTRTFPSESIPPKYEVRRLWVRGLKGGHSGTDIHKRYGNALVFLSRLWDVLFSSGDWRLQSVRGGDKHNALPREAFLDAWGPQEAWERIESQLPLWHQTFSQELGDNARDLEIKITPAVSEQALGRTNSKLLGDLLLSLPHGVWTMSTQIHNQVETSSNFASLNCEWLDGQLTVKIVFSVRSDRRSLLEALLSRYAAMGRLAEMKLEVKDAYPGWTPNPQSFLLQKALQTWKETAGYEAKVETVHAGLECGVFASKIPDLDMISLGPDIRNPHTPFEKLYLPSLKLVGTYLEKLLEALC